MAHHSNSVPSSRSSDSLDDLIDVGALLDALWRARTWIGGTVLACAVLGFVYGSFIATPRYKATAAIVLNSAEDQRMQLSSGLATLADFAGISTDSTNLTTQMHVLKARDLNGKVVDALNLLDDPEFNPVLADPEKFAHLENPRARDRTIKKLEDSVVIQNLSGSLVFNITVDTTDPTKSARIANTLAEIYVQDQIEEKFRASEKATAWLSARAAELKQEFEEAQARVTAYTTDKTLVTPGELLAEQRQLQDLRDRIAETDRKLAELNTRRAAMIAAKDDRIEEQMRVAQDAFLTELGSRMIGDTPPAPARLAAFEERYEELLADLTLDITRTDRQLASLRDTDASVRARTTQRSRDLVELQELERIAESTRTLYETFLSRLKETTAQQGTQSPDSRILNAAIEPFEAASPQKMLIIVMASMLGLLVSAGIALMRGSKPAGFRSPAELQTITDRPVLGQIPQVLVSDGPAWWPRKSALPRAGLMDYLVSHPTAVVNESARNLQTALLGVLGDRSARSVLVTSALPDEGKSTLSILLARNLARQGKSVLLYEGDARRHVFASFFPDSAKLALPGDLIHRDVKMGCDVRFADPRALDLDHPFRADAFAAELDSLRTRYDHIIVDAPPVLAVSDAQLMAPITDAMIFAVRWGETPRADVQEALRLLDQLHVNITGFALTQVSPKALGLQRYEGYFGPGDLQPAE